MRFILDEGLPRSAAIGLKANGVECDHVADLGLIGSIDERILEVANDLFATIVTLDADFHALVATSGSSSPSVVRIRVEGLKGPQLAHLVLGIATAYSGELEKGALITVTATRTAIHLLPVVARE